MGYLDLSGWFDEKLAYLQAFFMLPKRLLGHKMLTIYLIHSLRWGKGTKFIFCNSDVRPPMPHSFLAASDIFRREREAAKPLSPINGSIHSRVSTSLARFLARSTRTGETLGRANMRREGGPVKPCRNE